MLDDEMKMFIHLQGTKSHKAVPISKPPVNEDAELCIEAQQQFMAAVYKIRQPIVPFNTPLGNKSYIQSCQGERNVETEGGQQKVMRQG